MIEELHRAIERLQQQPEEIQLYIIGLVRDVLDFDEHERATASRQANADAETNTHASPDQSGTAKE